MTNRIKIVKTFPNRKNEEHRLPLTLLGTEHEVESETSHAFTTKSGLVVLREEAEVIY